MVSGRRRTAARAIAIGGTAVMTAAGLGGISTTTASATVSAATPCGNIYQQRDIAIGLPTLTVAGKASAGAVDLRSNDGTASRFSMASLTGTGGATANARFGSEVVVQDTDRDGCEDLLVGAPGAAGGKGGVYVVRGTNSGVATDGSTLVTAPDGAAGDEFGQGIAVSPPYNDGSVDLWVGAPGATVTGHAQAGRIYHFTLASSGTATYVDTVTYASSEVPGDAAAGDRLGAILYRVNGGVIAGVPRRDVAGRADAGEVVVVKQSVNGPLAAAAVNQNSPDVAGVAEAGDQFGASIGVEMLWGQAVVVGIPGEDIGPAVDAGAIQRIGTGLGADPSIGIGLAQNQDSAGVPGVIETGDRFGAAVSYQSNSFGEDVYYTLAVGSPGESIGSIRQAGTVSVILAGSDNPQPPGPKLLYQGGGLPAVAEAGDHVGATLSTVKGNELVDDHPTDYFLIGIPGEDGARQNSGLVNNVSRAIITYGAVGGPVTGLGYGTVLGIAGPGDQIFV